MRRSGAGGLAPEANRSAAAGAAAGAGAAPLGRRRTAIENQSAPFRFAQRPLRGRCFCFCFCFFSFRSFLSLSLLWFCLFCLLPMRNEGNDCVAIITVSSLVDWFAVRHGAAFVDSNSLPKKWMRLKCTEMVPTWSRHKKTYGYRKMVRAHKSRSYHGVSVL